ncbi:MAG TPA: TrbI/VirB10 family protein [Sphingobium sp.]
MAAAEDPRMAVEPTARPVIEPPRRIIPLWTIIVGGAALALILFVDLNARRIARSAPAAKAPAALQMAIDQNLPPLYLPPVMLTRGPDRMSRSPQAPPSVLRTIASVQSVPPPPISRQMVQPDFAVLPTPAKLPQPRVGRGTDQVLTFDGTIGDSGTAMADSAAPAGSGAAQLEGAVNSAGGSFMVRARAGNLLKRSTIVPQGTLIPAVLETALDSTRAGGARALVIRDVPGFDGAKILIPRGSRLYGEYRADLAPGQNRALVIWTRLVRPDGATVALDSPAADPLGRNGIRGRVNSHFLGRFGAALLQTALDIGSNVAVREISRSNTTVVAIPGGLTGISGGSSSGMSLTGSGSIQRTLTVRQGTSVSVFVARDLDFTAVDTP